MAMLNNVNIPPNGIPPSMRISENRKTISGSPKRTDRRFFFARGIGTQYPTEQRGSHVHAVTAIAEVSPDRVGDFMDHNGHARAQGELHEQRAAKEARNDKERDPSQICMEPEISRAGGSW